MSAGADVDVENYVHDSEIGRTFTEADADRVRDYLEAHPTADIGEIVRRLNISPEFRPQVAEAAGEPWPPRSNFVNSSTAGNQDFSEIGDSDLTYEQEIAERARMAVAEFAEEYPDLARLPLTSTSGTKLRAELVDEEYIEEFVEPDDEFEPGFTVDRLDRADPVTWAEAMFQMHTARTPYDDGIVGVFEADDGNMFHRKFTDCWTPAYAEKQAARNAGAERQIVGGTYPDTDKSALSGEREEGIWGGVATIMLTRTASSIPDGDRLSPVDHLDTIRSAWNTGTDGVYHTVRNICEKKLGLESDQWGYFRGDDPHGMGDENKGMNACYGHSHEAIYIDLAATDLRDSHGTDERIADALEEEFYSAIEKHLELCDPARPEAHEPGEAVSAFVGELEHPAAYATEYLRLNEEEPLLEMDVEFQAFATIAWATQRQRIARSKLFTEAAKVDLCKQDPDLEHGGQLTYKRTPHGDPEVVCAHCNSSLEIDAETVTEYRLAEDLPDEEGEERLLGVRIGEVPDERKVRDRVLDDIRVHGEPESVAGLMGRLQIDPSYRDVVEDAIENGAAPPREWVTGEGKDPPSPYRLVGIRKPDGSEETVSSVGGGASMVETHIPEATLLVETRLRYHGERGSPKIVCEQGGERFATYNPVQAAGWLADRGVRFPWHAEVCMTFKRYDSPVPTCFRDPVAGPPAAVA